MILHKGESLPAGHLKISPRLGRPSMLGEGGSLTSLEVWKPRSLLGESSRHFGAEEAKGTNPKTTQSESLCAGGAVVEVGALAQERQKARRPRTTTASENRPQSPPQNQ